jgi:hypothetical protein
MIKCLQQATGDQSVKSGLRSEDHSVECGHNVYEITTTFLLKRHINQIYKS